MHKMHLLGVRPEEEKFLTPEFMSAETFTAAESVLRERLQELKRAGYDQFVVQLGPWS